MPCVRFHFPSAPFVTQKDIKNNPVNKNLIKMCADCEKFATLWLQLKKWEGKYQQLKKIITHAAITYINILINPPIKLKGGRKIKNWPP